ncbi:hypothetical protein [Saccharothrix sp. ALI-22-I]|uniref:hypothetical protein n=1 Tax=Saccharothrix sp. ALI-22-I TaxID=1933778 RepID=UPI0015C3339E|nr:hypothetical protein [Saccharothrix sp. ALI-22-I]
MPLVRAAGPRPFVFLVDAELALGVGFQRVEQRGGLGTFGPVVPASTTTEAL